MYKQVYTTLWCISTCFQYCIIASVRDYVHIKPTRTEIIIMIIIIIIITIQFNSIFPPNMEIWQTLIHGTKHKNKYFKQYILKGKKNAG